MNHNFAFQAEFLKKHVDNEKEAGKYHEQIEIADYSMGNSYSKILGRFLDEYVTKVEIQDPYVRNIHQVLITNCCCCHDLYLTVIISIQGV